MSDTTSEHKKNLQHAYYPQQPIEITIQQPAPNNNVSNYAQQQIAVQEEPEQEPIYNPFNFSEEFLANETRLNPQFPVICHGIVQGSDAWLFAEASPRAARISQLLLGERLTVHHQEGEFLFVQSRSDAHCGWVHRSFIYTLKMRPHDARWRIRCNAAVTVEPDFRSPLRLCLPMGSLVNIAALSWDYVKVETVGWVHKKHIVSVDDKFDIVETARSLLGTGYVWGSRNPSFGLDCSALTQLCYSFAGRQLPRDSDLQRNYLFRNHQQIRASEMQAGDLIFIPGHTMIYSGENTVIHATAAFMRVIEEDFSVCIDRLKKQANGEKLAITAFHWIDTEDEEA
ncbi:MAG: C40 family peptidase [Cardiobacteriaceae bacterium]|nr:C40 family peptidase [Cardiobacteriaceae bacterium]